MKFFLSSSSIYLRPWQDEDIDLLYKGLNDPDVRETLFTFRPKSKEELMEEMKKDLSNEKNILLTICECSSNQPVGITAFYRIDYISRAAIFFLSLYDSSKWNHGYGSEATKLMIDYAFNILNLNRIQLHVSTENPKAISIYEKNGFILEGKLREAMYHNNRYVDFNVMSIIRSDIYKK
ncbi:MAG: GNAT family N-acetyltransferase [Melioribacter sp.]|nr:GNAT family N-acetyltransferase [Melioribacter sp.]